MKDEVKKMQEVLLRRIPESVPCMEAISDLELCTMNDYEMIVEEAEKNIRSASEETLRSWCKEWEAVYWA